MQPKLCAWQKGRFMNYTKFKDCVIRGLKEQVGEGKEVMVEKRIKTNDIELDSVTIFDHEHNVMPTLYLNDSYEKYRKGASIEEVIDEIICITEYYSGCTDLDFDFFDTFEESKDRIACKLINIERNEQLLEEVPYRRFLDLAIVAYSVMVHPDRSISTCLLTNSIIENWDVSVDEVIDWGIENTKEVMGELCLPLYSIVGDAFYDFGFDGDTLTEPDETPVFVLTNQRRVNGAASLLNHDLMKRIGMAFEDDLYIIPSSIHEVILIPSSQTVNRQKLDEITCNVNQTALDPKDFLSDHTYFYSRKLNEVMM